MKTFENVALSEKEVERTRSTKTFLLLGELASHKVFHIDEPIAFKTKVFIANVTSKVRGERYAF